MTNHTKDSKDKKDDSNEETFDHFYSNEIKEHLSKVNMDPWYYIYSNYVKPNPKKDQ